MPFTGLLAAGVIAGAGVGLMRGVGEWIRSGQNLDAQRQQMKYMQGAQQTQWDREDNAVQRRANDLRAAGLSPVLAAGSAAQSSSPIQVGAPQATSSGPEAVAGIGEGIQTALAMSQLSATVEGAKAAQAQASLTRSTEKINKENQPFNQAVMAATRKASMAAAYGQNTKTRIERIRAKNFEDQGVDPASISTPVGQAVQLKEVIGKWFHDDAYQKKLRGWIQHPTTGKNTHENVKTRREKALKKWAKEKMKYKRDPQGPYKGRKK